MNNIYFIWKKLPETVRFILSCFGTIILGALGTPMWNAILKPSCLFFVDKFFSIFFYISKGIETIIFSSIATLSLYSWILDIKLLLIVILFTPMLVLFCLKEPTFLEPILSKINRKNYYKISKILKYLFFINLFFIGLILFQDVYVCQMRIQFEEKLIEAHPYMLEKDFHLFNANFRKIRTKKDYDFIIANLDNIIKNNKDKY